jgi:hypothetical protein
MPSTLPPEVLPETSYSAVSIRYFGATSSDSELSRTAWAFPNSVTTACLSCYEKLAGHKAK